MLIFYPSYVIKHFLDFYANSADLVLYQKVQKLLFYYVLRIYEMMFKTKFSQYFQGPIHF